MAEASQVMFVISYRICAGPPRESPLVKSLSIWLLILVTTAQTSALEAQEMNAPASRWESSEAAVPPTVNMARLSFDVQEIGPPAPPSTESKPTVNPQNPAAPEKKRAEDDQESHQRVLGLAPMFNVVNDPSKARALTVHEKWQLFYRQTYDPFQFVSAGLSAAFNQAEDEFPEYGQGMEGYAKRYGAGFADNSLGAFFGNFALPSLLHDDPRYFRQGSGTFRSRLLHSVSATVITHRDNGTTRANYSNVFGNFIGCAFGNLYYPKSDRGVGTTFERGLQVTAYGGIGGLFQEFWPDIQGKIFKKHKLADMSPAVK
jgi:hypothetical protein